MGYAMKGAGTFVTQEAVKQRVVVTSFIYILYILKR